MAKIVGMVDAVAGLVPVLLAGNDCADPIVGPVVVGVTGELARLTDLLKAHRARLVGLLGPLLAISTSRC